MKVNNLFIFFTLLFLQIVHGQNKSLKDNESIQTVVRFDTPVEKSQAIAQLKSKNKLDKTNSYIPTYSNTDESGRTHEHFQQFYKGLKVEFGVIITHIQDNAVYMINGEVYNASNLDITPTISNTNALNIILNSKNYL